MAKITDYSVTPGDSVMIEGVVSFSRINNKIEGEALRIENERRSAAGMIPSTAPFWSINLDNPVIIYKSGDPNTPTPMEAFWANEKIYTKKSGGTACGSEKKGQVAPNVFQLVDGNRAIPLTLQGELASGSRVRIIVESYQAKMGLGYSFTSVLVLDNPVRYYEGNSIARALTNFGIKISTDEAGEVEETPVVEPTAQQTPQAPQAVEMTEPAPAPAPPQPTQNPFEQGAVTPGNPFNQ